MQGCDLVPDIPSIVRSHGICRSNRVNERRSEFIGSPLRQRRSSMWPGWRVWILPQDLHLQLPNRPLRNNLRLREGMPSYFLPRTALQNHIIRHWLLPAENLPFWHHRSPVLPTRHYRGLWLWCFYGCFNHTGVLLRFEGRMAPHTWHVWHRSHPLTLVQCVCPVLCWLFCVDLHCDVWTAADLYWRGVFLHPRCYLSAGPLPLPRLPGKPQRQGLSDGNRHHLLGNCPDNFPHHLLHAETNQNLYPSPYISAIGIMKAAADFTRQECMTMLIPLFIVLLQVGFLALWLTCLLFIYSEGSKEVEPINGTPFGWVVWNDYIQWWSVAYVVGLFWYVWGYIGWLTSLMDLDASGSALVQLSGTLRMDSQATLLLSP